MNHYIKFFILFLLISFLGMACKDSPTAAPATSAVQFSIPNSTEQVVMTHPDGAHKYSVFTDDSTKKKVAEIEFHPNGQPKIHKHFENEVLNGESWCYYADGKPWSLNTFKDGVYHGSYKTWHDNGQLNIDGHYENGKESGEWFTYYANGMLNTRGIYSEGQKTGVWSSYNLEGTLRKEQDFSVK
jgi:antitoxin component YwqK of YwqJK toxin-antitoxin module